MTTSWLGIKTAIAQRTREPAFTAIAGKLDQPYFIDRPIVGWPDIFAGTVIHGISEIEDAMLIEAQQLLREVPPELYYAIGAVAQVVITSATSPVNIPTEAVKLLGASIDLAPAEPVSLAAFYQRRRASSVQAIYTFSAVYPQGEILYIGGVNIRAVFLIEPSLADFQSDVRILPPGLEESLIDRVLTRLAIMIHNN